MAKIKCKNPYKTDAFVLNNDDINSIGPTVYAVLHMDEVVTVDGPALRVELRQKANYADPTTNVAVLLASVKPPRCKYRHQSVRFFAFGDSFYVEGVNPDFSPYFDNRGCSILFEVPEAAALQQLLSDAELRGI